MAEDLDKLKRPFEDLKLRRTAVVLNMVKFLGNVEESFKQQEEAQTMAGDALRKQRKESKRQQESTPQKVTKKENPQPQEYPKVVPSVDDDEDSDNVSVFARLTQTLQAGNEKLVKGVGDAVTPLKDELRSLSDTMLESVFGPLSGIAVLTKQIATKTLTNTAGFIKDRAVSFARWRRERKFHKSQLKEQRKTRKAVEGVEKLQKRGFLFRMLGTVMSTITNVLGLIGNLAGTLVSGLASALSPLLTALAPAALGTAVGLGLVMALKKLWNSEDPGSGNKKRGSTLDSMLEWGPFLPVKLGSMLLAKISGDKTSPAVRKQRAQDELVRREVDNANRRATSGTAADELINKALEQRGGKTILDRETIVQPPEKTKKDKQATVATRDLFTEGLIIDSPRVLEETQRTNSLLERVIKAVTGINTPEKTQVNQTTLHQTSVTENSGGLDADLDLLKDMLRTQE